MYNSAHKSQRDSKKTMLNHKLFTALMNNINISGFSAPDTINVINVRSIFKTFLQLIFSCNGQKIKLLLKMFL